ncbi:CU044_5270 family protein [Nonomuraea sp. ZG12]|uniref:CU044_5270 family protein n=1 Tax=Nonomuraea sp. ZG12 TaxID=3452207 RepID=UPI003F888E5A
MDDDFKNGEFKDFADNPPAVPPYRPEARARARERLLREARRGFRFPRLGWQVVATFGVTITLVGGVAVALSAQGTGTDQRISTATSVTSLAQQGFPELHPEPGQFILIESDTMYGFTAASAASAAKPTRHLYRTHRKIYQSVDGQAPGLLLIEQLEPKPWPGQELPENAHRLRGPTRSLLAACPDQLGDRRDDYSYLSTLPADPERMRERFYRDGAGDRDVAEAAFDAAGELVRETYLPRAQREAVFEAIKAMPGVEEARGVQDSAGRTGVALGRRSQGTLHQLIFDPATRTLLGERGTVVDAKVAGAPVGSLVAHTAALRVMVVDKLPEVGDVEGDGSCTAQPVLEADTPSPSASPVPSPSVAPTSPVPSASVAPTVAVPSASVVPRSSPDVVSTEAPDGRRARPSASPVPTTD